MMIRVGLPNNPSTPTSERIIQAQTELCQTYHEIVMTSMMASSFVDNGLMSSTWHYTQKGYNLLGSNVGTNVAFFVNTGKEPYAVVQLRQDNADLRLTKIGYALAETPHIFSTV